MRNYFRLPLVRWDSSHKQALLDDFEKKRQKQLPFWSYALGELGTRPYVRKQMEAIINWAAGVDTDDLPVGVEEDILYGPKPDVPLVSLTRNELRQICDVYDGLRPYVTPPSKTRYTLEQKQAAEITDARLPGWRVTAQNVWLYADMLADGNLYEPELVIPQRALLGNERYYWHVHGSESATLASPCDDLRIVPEQRAHKTIPRGLDHQSAEELRDWTPPRGVMFLPFYRSRLREYADLRFRELEYGDKKAGQAALGVRYSVPTSIRMIYMQGLDVDSLKVRLQLEQDHETREQLKKPGEAR